MPWAVPVTSATLPLSSPILAPSVLDEVAYFRDARPPQLQDFLVWPLVRAAEASVDGQAAQLGGRCLADDALWDQRLGALRHGHSGQARPRKVLHPRPVRGLLLVTLNDRPRARRVPPVVKEDLDPIFSRLGEPLAHHTCGE